DLETFINVLKCAFGTGCLAMPRAFKNAGWLTGLISAILVSSLVIYAMNVLLQDVRMLGRRHGIAKLRYRTAMELAVGQGPQKIRFLAKPFGYLVDFILFSYHFGVDCVYVIFIAKSLKHLGDLHFWNFDVRLYMAFLTVPLMLTFLIRNLKYLVPYAFVANILILISYIIILTYLVKDLPDFDEIHPTQPLRKWPLFFGTVLFAIESVGVLLALGQAMQNPDNFLGPCGVLNRAMILVVLFYMAFGFLGYWRFGEDTSNTILQNLPPDGIRSQVAVGCLGLAIFFSYALQGSVSVDIVWRGYLQPRLEEGAATSVEYLVRIALVLASVLVGIEFPDFGLVLSLVGSFCLAQLGLIFPGIVNICVCSVDGFGPGRILLWRSAMFIVVGLIGGVAGTITTLHTMNSRYPVLRL
ncbi:hypothetical protein KR009_001361, partial [Drosophila setifemur]